MVTLSTKATVGKTISAAAKLPELASITTSRVTTTTQFTTETTPPPTTTTPTPPQPPSTAVEGSQSTSSISSDGSNQSDPLTVLSTDLRTSMPSSEEEDEGFNEDSSRASSKSVKANGGAKGKAVVSFDVNISTAKCGTNQSRHHHHIYHHHYQLAAAAATAASASDSVTSSPSSTAAAVGRRHHYHHHHHHHHHYLTHTFTPHIAKDFADCCSESSATRIVACPKMNSIESDTGSEHSDSTMYYEALDSVELVARDEDLLSSPPPPPPLPLPVEGRMVTAAVNGDAASSVSFVITGPNGSVRGKRNTVRKSITNYKNLVEQANLEKCKRERDFLEEEKDKCVLYVTSLAIIRKTFEESKKIKAILKNNFIEFDERDVYINSEFKFELQKRRSGSETNELPLLYVSGELLGGYSAVEKLNESGSLVRMLDAYRTRYNSIEKQQHQQSPEIANKSKSAYLALTTDCSRCGGAKFVNCDKCNGSCKTRILHYERDTVSLKCSKCQKTGIVRCPQCS